ncbi:SDR family oxidoreductase [candidate division WWE3 bacterium]|uniref:SDR family oxidoreductase n=1 Tax=candidate division WWE3 bacterium TaxID=2053526 RepID=A0A7X9HSY0_UNCKA|nr:SDR family oxidoreductase [candidate division WWE3 bacterium]
MKETKEYKKVILITGGSEGLGKEIAKKLCKDNDVVILSNHQDTLEDTLKELGCDGYFCDITNAENIKSVVSEIEDKYKKINVLINNAGIWVGGELDDNEYGDIAKVILVNTVGTINMTKAVLPVMKKQKSGKIININSVNGIEVKPGRSVYIASKWAITGFTKAMSKELEKYNIKIVGIYPGLMKTNLFKNASADRDMSEAMDPEKVARIVEIAVFFDDVNLDEIVIRKNEY